MSCCRRRTGWRGALCRRCGSGVGIGTRGPRLLRGAVAGAVLPFARQLRGGHEQTRGFDASFALTRSVGDAFLDSYLPIVEKRRGIAYTEHERDFQAYRRGRYVEFNLVFDRGTLFGLQSGGRTESILLSMPPLAHWRYDWQPQAGTPEAELAAYLKPRDWV